MKKNEFRILVAEDDEMVRDVIVKFLEGEGYTVLLAEDGTSAIKLLRVEDIKLVLTDLRMPGADGMEVLRAALQADPKMSVVILTAYGTLDTALDAMKEGAYDYIVKPFVMQQLLLVVRNAFEMANLVEENEKLSLELKDMYRKMKRLESRSDIQNDESSDAIGYIESLEEMNIIDSGEAASLKERISGSVDRERVKKYGDLIDGLNSI